MIKCCMVMYIHRDVVWYGDLYLLGCKWVVHALLGSISNFAIQQGMFMFFCKMSAQLTVRLKVSTKCATYGHVETPYYLPFLTSQVPVERDLCTYSPNLCLNRA
jgi:hypothetical protein